MGKTHTLVVTDKKYASWLANLDHHRYSVHEEKVSALLVDFSNASFLQPYHLVSLACLIEEYAINGAEIIFTHSIYRLNNYLRNIKFYKYWSNGFSRKEYTLTHIETTFCLWQVSNELIDSYSNYAKEYFERNFFTGKDLISLSIALKEVFNNIYDHAASPVAGYVLTQYYPNRKRIIISICDYGVGIPAKINEMWVKRGKDPLPDADALRAAFKQKVTSQSTPRNRGLGLFYLLANVKHLKGDITVFSNNAFLQHGESIDLNIYRTEQKFPGTLINITLNTSYLPFAEEEISDEEFSF